MRFMLFSIIDLNDATRGGNGDRDAEWNAPQRMLLIGRLEDGRSVAVVVDEFYPYFYLTFPVSGGRVPTTTTVREQFEAVVDYCGTDLQCIYVHFSSKMHTYRIVARNLRHYYTLRKKAVELYSDEALYEHRGIGTPLRFSIDTSIVPCGWVQLDDNKCRTVLKLSQISKCDVEYECDDYRHLRSLSGDTATEAAADAPSSLIDSVAPLRTLWFDIECVDSRGMFPVPEHAETIMLSVVACTSTRIVYRRVYHLRRCSSPPPELECELIQCEDERQLLLSFAADVEAFDADFLGGFNSNRFDLPFVCDRAKLLGIYGRFMGLLSRMNTAKSTMRRQVMQSKTGGGSKTSRETILFDFRGRVAYDLLQIVLNEYTGLRSYTLNSVSKEFLDDQKEDVHHSVIPILYDGSDDDRLRLAAYCLKDSVLLHRIDTKLTLQLRYVEMCRVCGVDFDDLLQRGQQIKVISQLARMSHREHYLLPLKHAKPFTGYAPQGKFEGGAVLDPDIGYYGPDKPVSVLDYKSLYPSGIVSQNYSYETLVPEKQLNGLQPHEYRRSPSGHYFLVPVKDGGKRDGILPRILQHLLAARSRTKKALKKEPDAFRRSVLDARQLALKVSANSVYGFTGVPLKAGAMLPLFECSESTTAYGRQSLHRARQFILEHYAESDGAKVVYGDTDSVFVTFDTLRTVEDAWQRMQALAEEINERLFASEAPMEIEFEKIFCPLDLIQKKRYCGLKYEKSAEKSDAKLDYNGIEVVRRDNCTLITDTMRRVCQLVFVDNRIDEAVQCVKETVSQLYRREAPLDSLLLTKKLSREPDVYSNAQPHAELVKRMRQRDAGSAPRVGDRVIYVMVDRGNGAVSEMAEDPLYVLEHDVPINVNYYIYKQLYGPIERLLTPVVGAAVVQSIFNGAHTLHRNNRLGNNDRARGIVSFFTVQETCLVCGAAQSKRVCAECRKRKADRIEDIGEEYEVKAAVTRENYERVYRSCQQCQGLEGDAEVLCMARDCSQLYTRKELQKKMECALRDIEDLALD